MFRPLVLRALPRNVRTSLRTLSTLATNPYIYVFPHPKDPDSTSLLTFLSTSPPKVDLAIGSTTAIPPTPESVTENHHFTEVLQSVIEEFATQDPDIKSQAQAFASTGGAGLGSGAAFFGNSPARTPRRSIGGGGGAGGSGAGGASAQGGIGGAGVGGWIHAYDQRNPPDWGRIPYPEDIFGSLNVDGEGKFVGVDGSYQRSGTYRVCTNEGILMLSPFLREKLVQRLQQLEQSI